MAMKHGKAVAALAAVLALGLAGCGSRGVTRISDAPTVTYDGVMLGTVSETYDLADEHCARYSGRAQMLDDDKADGRISFACIN